LYKNSVNFFLKNLITEDLTKTAIEHIIGNEANKSNESNANLSNSINLPFGIKSISIIEINTSDDKKENEKDLKRHKRMTMNQFNTPRQPVHQAPQFSTSMNYQPKYQSSFASRYQSNYNSMQPNQGYGLQAQQPSYVPPQQPSYAPPQQPSYVPPQQPRYVPPQQPSYVAPQQQQQRYVPQIGRAHV